MELICSPHLPVHQVYREHTQVLIKELDVAIIYALCDFLANLMR